MPSSSTAVTYSCSRSLRQAAIWSLRRAVQRIGSCGTPAISITGRRPGVTVRGSVASPIASQTSAATNSLQSAEATTVFSYRAVVWIEPHFPSGRCPFTLKSRWS